MAATALGSLPRTPSEEVTFPYSYGKPPTYCDIPAPATPAAMLQRIEELETMLWKLMASDLQELVNHSYGPLRRTYGFFEVSARLANQEARRFGIKRTQRHHVPGTLKRTPAVAGPGTLPPHIFDARAPSALPCPGQSMTVERA